MRRAQAGSPGRLGAGGGRGLGADGEQPPGPTLLLDDGGMVALAGAGAEPRGDADAVVAGPVGEGPPPGRQLPWAVAVVGVVGARVGVLDARVVGVLGTWMVAGSLVVDGIGWVVPVAPAAPLVVAGAACSSSRSTPALAPVVAEAARRSPGSAPMLSASQATSRAISSRTSMPAAAAGPGGAR